MKTFFTSIRLLVALLTVTLFITPAFSQSGSNDATFNAETGANNSINRTAIQSDGKIIISGDFTTYDGTARNRIARLNTDGSFDAGFNTGTGADNSIYATSIQSDGKIIIGGSFFSYNGTTRFYLARLNTDGSLDAGFNTGTGANRTVYTTAIQSDGKIIIGGGFTAYNGTARNNIARLNTDGSLDATFNPGSGASDGGGLSGNSAEIVTTSIQSDGKIIIGGFFRSYNGTARNYIARLNTDGSLDAGFNPGTGGDNYINTTAIQSDGKIVIGGDFRTYNGTARSRIARLNTDGSLDTGFNPGAGANYPITTAAIQSDGKIIISGGFTTYNGVARNYLARVNTDGSLDAGFNAGAGPSGLANTTAIQSDGKIIIGGFFTDYNGSAISRIARLNSDGSLDAGFKRNTGVGGANDAIATSAIQSDGKIIIGGNFTAYNGTARNRIARLNTDGSLDAGFNPGTGADAAIRTAAIQSDGKIIIGGNFATYNGTARSRIARLNTDGSLDAGFNPGTGADAGIRTAAIQSDGKIVIGGDFDFYNGAARSSIARLNTDGSLDAGFNPGSGANAQVQTTSIQSDGKIIIGGAFSTYNGTVRRNIARLNTNGSLDAAFDPGSGVSADNILLRSLIFTTAIQSDGKIIIGGSFAFYNGTARNSIARVNTDGSLDAGFNPGTGVSFDPSTGLRDTIFATSIQSDGRIIIGGNFTSYNGTTRKNIARLNTDGSLDAGFNPGAGASNIILTNAIQSDGKIIIGGSFTSYNGNSRNRIARVISDAAALPLDDITIRAYQKSGGIQIEWMPKTETDINRYEVEKSADGIVFNRTSSVTSLGNTTQSRTYSSLDATPFTAINYYRVKSIAKSGVVKYSAIVKLNLNKGIPSISIYPLPITGNTLNLQFRNFEKGTYNISIINKMGQQLYRAQLQHSGGSATETIDVNNYLPAGLYQLHVTNASVNISMNIIKN